MASVAEDDPAIRVDGLVKEYGDEPIRAVDGVSAAVETGEVVGILGPNGAGKTTLIKSILGLVVPTAGDIEVQGDHVADLGRQLFDRVAAVLEGARNVYWRLSVWENVEYFTALQGIEPSTVQADNERLLDLLNLTEKRDEPVRKLSRGMKQKTAIACVLAQRTPVVFLDEPTLGLDVEASYDLRAELRRLAADENRTVVLSSHDMDTIEELCDRVLVMNEGRIVADETVDGLLDVFRTTAYEASVAESVGQADRRQIESAVESASWGTRGDETTVSVTLAGPEQVYGFVRALEACGLTVTDLSSVEPDLESAFLRITDTDPTDRDEATTPTTAEPTPEGSR